MKYEIKSPQAIYEIGQRENQEDSLFPAKGKATSNDRLFILCDGMGGHQSGEVASQTVCEGIGKYVLNETDPARPFTDAMLAEAIEKAYDALDGKDHTDSEKKMGTTMVFIYFHAGGVMAAHIGDSRYYHIRPKTHEIRYRSRDHSLANMSFEAGEVSLSDMATMPGRNVILRAMMPHQDVREMPDIVHIKDVRPGDYFFACSDGVLESMSDEELMNVICNKELSDEQKKNWLLTSTDGNKDNHSAWLIQVTGVMAEEIDKDQPDDEAEARLKNKLLLAELGELTQDWLAEDSTPENHTEELKYTPEPDDNPAVFSAPAAKERNGKKSLLWVWIALAVLAVMASIALCMTFFGQDSKKSPQIKYQRIENERRYEQPSYSDNDNAENVVRESAARDSRNNSNTKTTETSSSTTTQPGPTPGQNNSKTKPLNQNAIKDQLRNPEPTNPERIQMQEDVDKLRKIVDEENKPGTTDKDVEKEKSKSPTPKGQGDNKSLDLGV
ncbi:MAG: serine/threonine-protein phosphatase [Prevotella sp.]|nr:serine/threonine-protein phosphatase [Prevotella sp.]